MELFELPQQAQQGLGITLMGGGHRLQAFEVGKGFRRDSHGIRGWHGAGSGPSD
jgi:hypothetical protein